VQGLSRSKIFNVPLPDGKLDLDGLLFRHQRVPRLSGSRQPSVVCGSDHGWLVPAHDKACLPSSNKAAVRTDRRGSRTSLFCSRTVG
jgi:hypothetical protein